MFDASDTVASFGERNFGHCFLGDPRRTRRLVRAADQILAHPDKALPHKFASPKDYRAVLRLVNHPAVTHAALLRVHAQRVLEQLRADGPAVVVLPEDTTELDFSGQNTLAALGPSATAAFRASSATTPSPSIPTAAPSTAWSIRSCTAAARCPKAKAPTPNAATPSVRAACGSKPPTTSGRRPRANSGCMSAIARRTPSSTSTSWFASRRSFVFRSCQNRALEVEADDGGPRLLHDRLRALPCQATWAVEVSAQKAKNSQPARLGRVATVCAAALAVRIKAPHAHNGEHGKEAAGGVGDPSLGAAAAGGPGGVGVVAVDGPGDPGSDASARGGGLLRVPRGGGGVPQVPEDGRGDRVTATAKPCGVGADDRVAERGGGAAGEPACGGAAGGELPRNRPASWSMGSGCGC